MTISLDAGLVRRIEQRRRKERSSRSALIEQMLLEAERQRKREALDREIEEFYRKQTPEERAEDRAWARLGMKAWAADPDLAKDDW